MMYTSQASLHCLIPSEGHVETFCLWFDTNIVKTVRNTAIIQKHEPFAANGSKTGPTGKLLPATCR
jgi:hypothetical protein